MNKSVLILCSVLVAIGGCDSPVSTATPQTGTAACSADGQKQFVLQRMNDLYFWNDLLPQNVDLNAYATAEDLLAYLISFQPLDDFSYIDLASADAQFFAAGQYHGYGFSSRFEDVDDIRFTRVFQSSPAAAAGLQRGQRILMLDGRSIADIEADEGVAALFEQESLEFTLQRTDGSEFTVLLEQGVVTINPLPQWRIIDRSDGTSVGYFELATFIGTADAAFETMFAEFQQAAVTDIIIDLRYNGGGLVSTTELLGDYLGGAIATNLVFSKTLFNANNAVSNRTRFFRRLLNSTSTSRLVVVSGDRTASASELITNSMMAHVDVSLVGGTTFGKPVGQLGIEFCDKILRPTAFESVNANDEGRYYDGIPVDCPAVDDLSIPVGDDQDENLVTALALLETGACPAMSSSSASTMKPSLDRRTADDRTRGVPWREFANAW